MNSRIDKPEPVACGCTTYCKLSPPPTNRAHTPLRYGEFCKERAEPKAAQVLQFKQRDNGLPALWMCGCGCKKFALCEGGQIQCWECSSFQKPTHSADRES